MAALARDDGEIHLPERWAVLEAALRQMNAERQGDVEAETAADISVESAADWTSRE